MTRLDLFAIERLADMPSAPLLTKQVCVAAASLDLPQRPTNLMAHGLLSAAHPRSAGNHAAVRPQVAKQLSSDGWL